MKVDIYVQIDCVQTRDTDVEPGTAWSLFNCCTEVLKAQSIFLAPRIQALHALLDQFCGVAKLFAYREDRP